jgi:heat shock protein HslJ
MKPFSLSIVIIFAGLIQSCSPKLSPDYGWDNKRWILIELKEVPVQLSGGSRDAYLEFFPGEKRFAGNAGCNHITGNYTLEKNEIRFGEVTSTKMACPDLPFETTFLQVLAEVDRYEVTDDVMLLKDGSKVLMMFRPR